MSKRKKRKLNRSTVPKRFSANVINTGSSLDPRARMFNAEAQARARYESAASIRARVMREKYEDQQWWARYGVILYPKPKGTEQLEPDWFIQRDTIIQFLKDSETAYDKCVCMEPGKYTNLWLHWRNDYESWFFVQVDVLEGCVRKSILYKSRERARQVYFRGSIVWGVKQSIIPG